MLRGFTQGVAGRTAYASGILAAIGIVFAIAMFASFGVGATSAGRTFGLLNDVLVPIWAFTLGRRFLRSFGEPDRPDPGHPGPEGPDPGPT